MTDLIQQRRLGGGIRYLLFGSFNTWSVDTLKRSGNAPGEQ